MDNGRRRVIAWPAATLLAAALVAVLAVAGCRPELPAKRQAARPLMGTMVTMTVEGHDASRLGAAMEAGYREMARLSDMMSHYDPNSVVSSINAAAGLRPVVAPPELLQVLRMASAVSVATGGGFDVTVGSLRGWRSGTEAAPVPAAAEMQAQRMLVDYRQVVLDDAAGTVFLARPGMRLDLGGIAKLYILEAGMRTLRGHGIDSAMINGGGDVLVAGAGRAEPWLVGVRDPRAPSRLLGVVAIRDGIVASSGDYERFFMHEGRRYRHILDPRTGIPAEGPHGVTLVADRLETLNGLGAAIMVLGAERGRELIGGTPDLEGLIVDRDGSVWMSPGFRQLLH